MHHDLQAEADLESVKKPTSGPLDPRAIIGFYHVDLEYSDQKALSDASFTVSNGEFLCLTGPSGAGKSAHATRRRANRAVT